MLHRLILLLNFCVVASSESTIPIIVRMRAGTQSVLTRNRNTRFASRGRKIAALRHELMENAKESQDSVLRLLKSSRINGIKRFWITNSIYIPHATEKLIQTLRELPQVSEIHQEHVIQLDSMPVESVVYHQNSSTQPQWGIQQVAADRVWSEKGIQGENVVVATIDSGVRGTHEALKHNFKGKYGWYDPYYKTKEPVDLNGHGTHTTGIIAGGLGFGVAPKAEWMACRGCTHFNCTEAGLIECGEFLLCPHGLDGPNDNPDCSHAPHVASCSWGIKTSNFWYQQVTDSWREAGIIPVFSQGNAGPECGTVYSPGDYAGVIGVGATGEDGQIAAFSSRGPAFDFDGSELIKPDVAAPGHKVLSAWPKGDQSYYTLSGTSMACPHTAGVIALMISHRPGLNYRFDEVKQILTGTCRTQDIIRRDDDQVCGTNADSFPNNIYGYGVINAFDAINALN